MKLIAAYGKDARRRWHFAAFAAALAAMAMLSGCATVRQAVPGCGDPQRLAIVAQSVPGASYVPCLSQLPQGWSASAFDVARGGTSFLLNSDRALGRPVRIGLTHECRTAGAVPTRPHAEGVRTYIRLSAISPRFVGSLYDVFPGGCVTYTFNFDRGPHIALMEQFEAAAGLYARQQLRLDLRKKLGVELDP